MSSRWSKGGIRQSVARMVEDDRQVKDKRGKWRRSVDEVDEIAYCLRRREPRGFSRGARVTKR